MNMEGKQPKEKKTGNGSTPRVLPIVSGGAPHSPYIIRLSRENGHNPAAMRQALKRELGATDDDLVANFDEQVKEEALMRELKGLDILSLNADEFMEDERDEAPLYIIEDDIFISQEETPVLSLPVAGADAVAPEPAPVAARPTWFARVEEKPTRAPKRVSVSMVFAFVGLAALFILPMKLTGTLMLEAKKADTVMSVGKTGVEHLGAGLALLGASDFSGATSNLSGAARDFAEAKSTIESLPQTLKLAANMLPAQREMLKAANAFTDAGAVTAELLDVTAKAAQEIDNATTLTLTDKLELLSEITKPLAPRMALAAENVGKVSTEDLPASIAGQVATAQSVLPLLADGLSAFTEDADVLTAALGQGATAHYLVVFQNNAELRATGGFIGSYAEVDVRDGALTKVNVPGGGSYSRQGQLTAFVASPEPLTLLNSRWEFQDANWFPDFPTSARKLLWFHEKSGGPTMDGVVAVNATFLEDVLRVTGPLTLKDGTVIDAENVLFTLRQDIDARNADGTTASAPKVIIGDVMQAVMDKTATLDGKSFVALTQTLLQALSARDVQVYFTNDSLMARADKAGWTGRLAQEDADYLMIANSNLGGGKTDLVVGQKVDVATTIAEDGAVEHTVTLTKTHHGIKGAPGMTGLNNVDYVRFYVPKGSQIMGVEGAAIPAASAFEQSEIDLAEDADLAMLQQGRRKDPLTGTDIWEESGKTVFGTYMQTKPGETVELRVTYRSGYRVTGHEYAPLIARALKVVDRAEAVRYGLLVQAQSGVKTRDVAVRVVAPQSWTKMSSVGDDTFRGDHDAYYGIVFERPRQ